MKNVKWTRIVALCLLLLSLVVLPANQSPTKAWGTTVSSANLGILVSSLEELKVGTYKATASEEIVDNQFGFKRSASPTNIKIKIKSVDDNGNVKAEVQIAGGLQRKGALSGKLASSGKLELDGGLVDSKDTVYETKLTATVKDGSLTNGKYMSRGGIFKATGEFNLAVLVEDED